MNATAQTAALLAAIAHVVAAPMEMSFFREPWARKFLHVEVDNLEDVRMWAFVVGFRNLLAGVGALVGLVILHNGDEAVGEAVTLTVMTYMLLAGLAMGLADVLGLWRPRGGSVLGVIGSSLFPLVALVSAGL